MNPRPTEDLSLASPSSATWANHFRLNRDRDWSIPWASGPSLTANVAAKIASSIAEFQRGESSEAHGYLAKSQAFSTASGDEIFHVVSLLFVREENHHAALLLRFMEQVGLPRKKRTWTDGVFRWLRRGQDLGWASRVLIVAELIAQAYYPCLKAATTHPVLQRICDKIIYDEADHIRFQVERIARVEARCSALTLAGRDALQSVLMAGAAAVVYPGHRRVLDSRLGAWAFAQEVMARNRAALETMRRLRAGQLGLGQGESARAGLA